MKAFILSILASLGIIGGGSLMLGAPNNTFQRDIYPETDSTYTLGSTTLSWLNVYTDELCLAGDCETTWPSGGSSSLTDSFVAFGAPDDTVTGTSQFTFNSTTLLLSVPYVTSTIVTSTNFCLTGDDCITSWPSDTDTTSTPGGSDTYVQYNDNGVFGGDAGLRYNDTTDQLSVTSVSSTNATSTNFFATSSIFVSVTSTNGFFTTLSGTTFNPTNLTAVNATSTNMNVTGLTFTTAVGTSATTTNLTSERLILNKNNTASGLTSVGSAHLVLDNPNASGQTMLIFVINGTAKGGIRGDFAGNVNWHATGSQGHQFYSTLNTTGPIMGLSSTGVIIGGAAGDAALNKLDVEGAVAIGSGFADTFTAPTNGLLVGGFVGIGTSTVSSALTFSASTTAAGGLLFGADTNLYRSGANTLTTDDSLVIGGDLTLSGALHIAGEISLDGLPDSDHTAVGNTTDDYDAGATVAAIDLLYMASDGEWAEADASASTTGQGMLAIALEAGTDNNPLNVALPGSFVRDDSWNWTIGSRLFMSETTGAITATAPTTTPSVIRVIGYATTADVIWFDPDNTLIINSD